MGKQNDLKTKILKAAAKIINEEGIFSLTLESVAKAAGISKGGLLYHFSNKEALLEGMINYLLLNFNKDLEDNVQKDNFARGRWTRAYINLTFNQEKYDIDMNTAFLAAAAAKPDLLKTMAQQLKLVHSHIENDKIDPVIATIIRLAVDGMYFNQLYGLYLNKNLYEKILQYLISMTREDKL
ncbi:TetR/AcrR family transcriptional regulator [Pectinatus haikarae]|uniref:AcrR family transcriptional regulator n=1 Tax=Pectinatus haikarae TaxID=349096 RepID=A0ABT9Y6S0_9FIRM|nr:TetR/AcrR family transcriptional regulator [Pectinatus haikarae]MDQ0203513.1 AcrR family transcriptional regulator [Pectinatus haikarae]